MCEADAFDGVALSPGVINRLGATGVMVKQCRWRYGDAPRTPFPPHKALAGAFTTITGNAGSGFDGFSGWHPGDHKGCLCSLVPVFCARPVTAALVPDALVAAMAVEDCEAPVVIPPAKLGPPPAKTWKGVVTKSKTWKPKDQDIMDMWINQDAKRTNRMRQAMVKREVGTEGAELAKRLDAELANAPDFEGTMYRGISVDEKTASQILSNLDKTGARWGTQVHESFSSAKDVAEQFAINGDVGIVFKVEGGTGKGLGRFSIKNEASGLLEEEIVALPGQVWEVKSVKWTPRKVKRLVNGVDTESFGWVVDVTLKAAA